MSTAKEENKTTPAATKKQAANKTTPAAEQVKTENPVKEVQETKQEEIKQGTPEAKASPELDKKAEEKQPEEKPAPEKKEKVEQVVLPTNEEAINSYYDALKEYFEETGSLPDKELNTAQIYGAVSIERENKHISEMKRLEILEANKPKTFAVTDGKTTINVTEKTFAYLGKEWKKSPTEPKEVQELKKQ